MGAIRERFETLAPGHEASKQMTNWRKRFADLAEEISAGTPVSREQSLALTKLEEVKYWVNQSIIVADNDMHRAITTEGADE